MNMKKEEMKKIMESRGNPFHILHRSGQEALLVHAGDAKHAGITQRRYHKAAFRRVANVKHVFGRYRQNTGALQAIS